jgi:prepilin peptidase CpaA
LSRHAWIARLHDSKTGVPYGVALAAAGMMFYPHTEIWRAAAGL